MVIASNIGPHPLSIKGASSGEEAAELTRIELFRLVEKLHEYSDFFVVNLSSPNTPGLRGLLEQGGLARIVLVPLRTRLAELGPRDRVRPILVKIGAEDAQEQPWTKESLSRIITPMLEHNACDGFVATNTSTRLARELATTWASVGPTSGGLSGEPIRETSLATVRLLRGMCNEQGKPVLIIGCGGIMEPEHGRQFLEAGADLVELYTGFIYGGPGIINDIARSCVKVS